MRLDPCPWCSRQPHVKYFNHFDHYWGMSIDMVTISCCHASLTCDEEDAEDMWNYASGGHRSRQPTRQSNEGSLSVVYDGYWAEDLDEP